MATDSRRSRRISCVLLGVALTSNPALPQTAERVDPFESGVIERTGVRLTLIDVEARDDQGRPMRGLLPADFEIFLDGRAWPLYSADDQCACPDEAVPASKPTLATSPGPSGEPRRFVLYIDYGQLSTDGRATAVAEAKRWVEQTMLADDEVMVAAWATAAGLEVLQEFTRDRSRLLAAIERSATAPKFVDPFPTLRESRQRFDDPFQAGRDEYYHGRNSLLALQRLLVRLERERGRKILLLFHQMGTQFPARYYFSDDAIAQNPDIEFRIGDHVSLLDRIAADATLARTTIYTAYVGDMGNGYAVNLGANLADFTGGGYNRGPTDLVGLVQGAGQGCACTYRLGFEPPDDDKDKIYRIRVEARGRSLSGRWRVQRLDEGDRFMRSAIAVLDNPEEATEIPVVASLLPVFSDDEDWGVRVQVALGAEGLTLVPEGKRAVGRWEVGALLFDEAGRGSWEMLGVSELKRDRKGEAPVAVLHERVIADVRPGRYELRAFVRDRVAETHGGARASIELPRARGPGIIGPSVVVGERPLVVASLPMRRKKVEAATRGTVRRGGLPLGARPIVRGEPVVFTTWICPKENKDSVWEAQRYVSRGEEPIFRFDKPTIARVGGCASVTDSLDTSPMQDGEYRYTLRWEPSPGADPLTVEAAFTVAALASPPSEPVADESSEPVAADRGAR